MVYRCAWENGREEVTMFLDECQGDGWLVLAEGRAAEEHVCTLYWSGRTLHGVIWRGPATDRPQVWRDEQQGHIRDALARLVMRGSPPSDLGSAGDSGLWTQLTEWTQLDRVRLELGKHCPSRHGQN